MGFGINMRKYFNYVIKITFTLIVYVILLIILEKIDRVEDEGLLLILVISFLVGFSSNLRILYKEGGKLDKGLILLSFYWLVSSSSYLVLFYSYEFEDFFGRYALYTASILLYPAVLLIIGRWFYGVYRNSL